jgi:hypothetical protein
MAIEIDWEPRGFVRRFRGFVTGAELMQSVAAVGGDPRFDDLRYVINDCRAVEGFDVTAEKIRLVAALDGAAARTNPRVRIAVVTTDERILDLAAMYAASPLAPYPTRCFPSLEEARTWLDVETEPDFAIGLTAALKGA